MAKKKEHFDDSVIRGLQSLNVALPDDLLEKVASTFEGKLPIDRFRADFLKYHDPEGSSATAAQDVETTTSFQGANGSTGYNSG
ncbi:hypothetical protein CMUS01_14563 [Colletotrichum musicola]|uniref:Uncharacterized protein n=1 Tax=Colletotrichum musicola TaxID=2175873 RepID=A0A8H6J370_9PEZI|nr:hypothetical protein CMUS01_14563 [Colletotrichum musicola]